MLLPGIDAEYCSRVLSPSKPEDDSLGESLRLACATICRKLTPSCQSDYERYPGHPDVFLSQIPLMGFSVADLITPEKPRKIDTPKDQKLPDISIMISWDTKPEDVIRLRQLVFILIFTALTIGFAQVFRSWQRLRHIPGPFWASISDFPRLFWVRTKKAHLIHQQMHEKYGEVVRIGPKTVIFRDPAAIPTVYPMRAGFPKV